VVREPKVDLDARYGSPGIVPTTWAEALRHFEEAQVYWVVTVRRAGGPHVTPLFGVAVEGALYFFTGPREQKARNVAANPRCALMTGCNVIDGLDVVVEGEAVRVRDETTLRRVADAVATKYADGAGLGDDWRFGVRNGMFVGPGGNEALLFALAPRRGYAFGKGKTFSHTRFRFDP
jgi:nitroimidazol reductase NimA-like FMN-containing flavoprotein (pyridoxamine 5'-phosphate oxidase superfamily)